jgi:hypothetical protein
MTARDVLENGPTLKRMKAPYGKSLAQIEWRDNDTFRRFAELPNKLVIRRMNIRRANRKMRRQSGMDLKFA